MDEAIANILMEEAKPVRSFEPTPTEGEARDLLRLVIDSFPAELKSNLLQNIKSGKTLNCGPRAYVFTAADSGDLITLSLSTSLPSHVLDFTRIKELEVMSKDFYRQLVAKHGLLYYLSTQVMDETSFKVLILECLEQADQNAAKP